MRRPVVSSVETWRNAFFFCSSSSEEGAGWRCRGELEGGGGKSAPSIRAKLDKESGTRSVRLDPSSRSSKPESTRSPPFHPHSWWGSFDWAPVHAGVRPIEVLLSRRRYRSTRDANAVAWTGHSVVPLGVVEVSGSTWSLESFDQVLLVWGGWLGYAEIFLRCWKSGSYLSPLAQRRWSRTESLRATAITARFLAFFAPVTESFSPWCLRSDCPLRGPRM